MRTISTRIAYRLRRSNAFDTAPLETMRREIADMRRHLDAASARLAELEVHENESAATVENLRTSAAMCAMLRGSLDNIRPILTRATDDMTYAITVRNDIRDSIDCNPQYTDDFELAAKRG